MSPENLLTESKKREDLKRLYLQTTTPPCDTSLKQLLNDGWRIIHHYKEDSDEKDIEVICEKEIFPISVRVPTVYSDASAVGTALNIIKLKLFRSMQKVQKHLWQDPTWN